jgi:Transposase IS66 family
VEEIIQKDLVNLDMDKINFDDKESVNSLIITLLNVIEQLLQENQQLRVEVQRLKDENARLKGEKGKPKVAPNVPSREPKSAHAEKPKTWSKDSKKSKIKIDRVVVLEIDPETFPPDVIHKGYSSVIIQNIRLQTDNVEYRREHYYSPSINKNYYAELPKDVQNTQFGSDLKALVAELYYVGRVTENKIHRVFTDFSIIISEGEISNILTKEKCEVFEAEKTAIFQMGMMHADYFQTDETGARHQGKNYYMHYFGNERFSAYFIEKSKSRGTIRGILGLLEGVLTCTPMTTDGARQYKGIAIWHALCWIHEIRFYKMLKPYLDLHRSILEKFMNNLWEFYDLLTLTSRM